MLGREMPPRLGALVLFAADLERAVEFYRAIGIDLQVDDHDDPAAPVHYAADLDGCHFAVFPAAEPGRSPAFRAAGGDFPGFAVADVERTVEALRGRGAEVVQEPSPYPPGLRAVVTDPDGRPVEIYTPPASDG